MTPEPSGGRDGAVRATDASGTEAGPDPLRHVTERLDQLEDAPPDQVVAAVEEAHAVVVLELRRLGEG